MKLDDIPQPEEVTMLHPDEFNFDGENPNSMNPDMFELLCDKIRQRGWVGNHVITDMNNVIADGEHRVRAATEIGLEEVPVKKYDLTLSERKTIRQEMNKLSGEHDAERDALEFEKIVGSEDESDLESLLDARDESLEWYMEDQDYEEYDDDTDVAFKSECPECGHEWYE